MKTNDVILQTMTKILVFIIFAYAINLFLAGHYTAGGGFIGGLMAAGAIVLLLLAFDMKTVRSILPFNFISMTALGLLIAVGTGVGAFLFDVPFLTHTFGYFDLPIIGKTGLATAVLFDIGVFLVVVGIVMVIIQTIGEDE
ncbi:Na(+)/H(+) antiporter subunit B [Bacillus luteolus]|uniref:Na(+)/H(+) antiporter subunit B n=1 Tax=Litchfieldia luteola TaxID=682179 RepID=A0ABR9QGA1_9BACI|nr:Na(+)/H(+) antiporter subunit B [Cytobacillus luteolus]MBE4907456.1 Na(+)/H(+) antiporter subunit B [Cytobacillus luteolus]MBP1944223.1 multicomponent Na+:H+ antiporter subunit B [Cytobacillus luteolus]